MHSTKVKCTGCGRKRDEGVSCVRCWHKSFDKRRHYAIKRGIAWELSKDEFFHLRSLGCYYCNSVEDVIGLDRLDPSKGYVISNVVSCCVNCNTGKSDNTVGEFLKHVLKICEYNRLNEKEVMGGTLTLRILSGKNFKIGITGSRHGATEQQLASAIREIKEIYLRNQDRYNVCLLHGDCVGFDKQIHDAVSAELPGIYIIVLPPKSDELRAFCSGHEVRPEDGYLSRDRKIAAESNIMISAPFSDSIDDSGSWYTTQKAMPYIPVVHVLRDGSVEALGQEHD